MLDHIVVTSKTISSQRFYLCLFDSENTMLHIYVLTSQIKTLLIICTATFECTFYKYGQQQDLLIRYAPILSKQDLPRLRCLLLFLFIKITVIAAEWKTSKRFTEHLRITVLSTTQMMT